MKKILLAVFSGIAIRLYSCNSGGGDPKAVLGQFFSALEKKDLAVDLLHQNIAKFKLEDKVKVIATEAPKGLDELPNCDVVFIGGSGKHMFEILDIIDSKLNEGGRIIVNAVTIQTISEITTYMKQKESYTYEAIQVQVNRLRQIGSYDMFNAQNPVYIVTCKKLK